MKKFLLSLAACGMALSSMALTTSAFDNKTVAVMCNGHDFQFSLPVSTCSSSITAKGSSQFQIDNFFNGFPITANFSGNNIVLKDFTGGYSPYYGNNYFGTFFKAKSAQYTATIDGQTVVFMVWAWPTGDTGYGDYTTHTYQGGDDISGWAWGCQGGYTLVNEIYDISKGTNNATLADLAAINGGQIYAYNTNAVASEYQGKAIADMYNVDVTMADGKITIRNFLNQGMSSTVDPDNVKYGLNFVNGTYDENGNINLPIQEISGDFDWGFLGDGSDNDCFMGMGALDTGLPEGYWFAYYGTDYYPWYLVDYTTWDPKSFTAASIDGYYTTGEATHNTTNRWHPTCGGDLSTTTGSTIVFDNVGIVATMWGEVVGQADKIEINSPVDKTANIGMKISKASYWNENCYVKGSLIGAENADLVDHFDIYAVPGNYKSVSDGGFFFDDEKGHYDAVLVYDGSDETDDHEYIFNETYTIPGMENDGTQPITFFAKANYKAETGLHPTFHALTTYSVPTSVEALEADNSEVAPEYYNTLGVRIDNPVKGQVVIERRGDKVSKVIL